MSKALDSQVHERSMGECELCHHTEGLKVHHVGPQEGEHLERCLLLCERCRPQLDGRVSLEANHWFCLKEAVWSDVPVVQVYAWRLLHRLDEEVWAQDLLEQVYLEESVLLWAKDGLSGHDDASEPPTLDSHGVALKDGDAVTLIKDLSVKGAGFTAKRGTTVKNIRVGNDSSHIEGRVNGVSILLKTCFLKKL